MMKTKTTYLKLLIIFIVVLTSILSCSQERKLVWEEKFEGTELNEKVWNFELGDGCPDLCGWGNNERQFYTKKNHKIENGNLIIKAIKVDSIYTSTRITTRSKKEFQYGYIEARAILPIGKGIWPAFWMLGSNISEVGWPLCGEIDILEYVGKEPNMVFNSLHTKESHGNTLNTKKTKIENIEDGFHVYAVDWTSEKMDFYVDGNLLYTFNPIKHTTETWPFDQPFYFILNTAIGGNFGGPEVDDTIFPQEFIIDYIRVYQ